MKVPISFGTVDYMGCIFASMSQLGVILSSNKHANRSRSLQHHHPHQNHLRRHQLASYFSCGSLSSWQQHLLQWISHLHSCEHAQIRAAGSVGRAVPARNFRRAARGGGSVGRPVPGRDRPFWQAWVGRSVTFNEQSTSRRLIARRERVHCITVITVKVHSDL